MASTQPHYFLHTTESCLRLLLPLLHLSTLHSYIIAYHSAGCNIGVHDFSSCMLHHSLLELAVAVLAPQYPPAFMALELASFFEGLAHFMRNSKQRLHVDSIAASQEADSISASEERTGIKEHGAHTHTHIYIYIYTCIYVRTHTHTHTHIHMHIHM